MDRREFIRKASLAAGAVALGAGIDEVSAEVPHMKTRPLGKTGWDASIVAMGGIVVMNETQEHANRIVAQAIRDGVNYFDVAPTYGDAEIKLGEALKPFRSQIWLACKTAKRTKAEAEAELYESLKRLQTDHVDLYQLHGLDTLEDLNIALGPKGAMEAILEAKKAGLVRHIGITGHKPATHLEAIRRFPFETVMVPVNFSLMAHSGFAKDLLAEAAHRGLGVLAIKPIAERPWHKDETRVAPKCWYKPLSDPKQIDLAMRFTLSQPITAAIPSGDPHLFRRAVVAGRNYRPLTPQEDAALRQLAEGKEPIFT